MSNRLKLLRERATRPRQTVPILLDGAIREQIEAVEDELDRLDEAEKTADRRLSTRSNSARRKELVADLDRLRAEAEESTLFLVLEGLQRTAFRALRAQHPPRIEDGKVLLQDRIVGANAETLAAPLVRACAIGYREKPEADSPVLDFPPDGTPGEVTLGWLFGHNMPAVGDEPARVVEPWCTERQIDQASGVAIMLCAGDDAVPLPRRRSATEMSAGE